MRATRTWIAGALRRPLRGLLVVVGLVAMGVATVAALVAADSLETLFIEDALAEWGEVDVVVASPGGAVFSESLARAVGVEGGDHSPAWAPRLLLDAVVTAPGGREPLGTLFGLTAQEEMFSEPLTGEGTVDVVALGPEEVVVNRRLAERVGLGLGDPVPLVIAVPEVIEREPDGRITEERDPEAIAWQPVVAGIAEDTGVADFGRTANILARLDSVQRVTDLSGHVTAVHAAALAPGEDAAEDLIDSYAGLMRQVGLVAFAAKEDSLEIAQDEAAQFRGILLSLAMLVVAASAAVTVNLVALLGEARAGEVALLRAMGARRRTVTRLLTAEGGVYAILAALGGAVLALPLANLLAGGIGDHFASIELGRGREQVALELQAGAGTVATGILTVFLVAILAVRSGARRVAAIDVEAVLRGAPVSAVTPEPSGIRRPMLAWSGGLLLLGMGFTAVAGGGFLRFTGISLLLVAWWLWARRSTTRRVRLDTRAALGGLVWCVVAPMLLADFAPGDVQAGFGILTVAGAGAIACATVLATAHLRSVMRYLRGYVPRGRLQAAFRTAGAYAEHQRSRSGTVVAVVGIVLFMVAAMAVLGSATAIDPQRQRGGFDVVGTAVAPLDVQALSEVEGVALAVAVPHTVLAERAYWAEDDDGNEASVPYPVNLARAEGSFVRFQGFGLAAALPEYENAVQALEAAVFDGDGVVVDRYSRPEGASPGDTVLIDDGAGPREFELLAVLDTFVLNTVFLGPDSFDEIVRSRGPTMLLAAAAPDADPARVAEALTSAGLDRGLVAQTVEEAAAEVVRINRTFTDVFAFMLQLGLAVALVAVAALLARAVRERRAHLAVLRALGLRRRHIAAGLLAEPLLTGLVGIVLGGVIGLGVLWLLFLVGFADLAFVVDWGQVGTTVGVTLATLLAACVIPAALGARRDPAADLHDLG